MEVHLGIYKYNERRKRIDSIDIMQFIRRKFIQRYKIIQDAST